MSVSTISISYDSIDESIGSFVSYLILLDSVIAVAVVPAIALEVAPEAEAAVFALPIAVLDHVLESNSKTKPSKAPPSLDYAAEPLAVLDAHTPPRPCQIVPVPLVSPCKPTILVRHRQAIPFGLPYRIHPNRISHPSSAPPPHKRRRVLIYSSTLSASLSPLPSVRPSRKRCRSHTQPLPVAAASSLPTDLVPHRKRIKAEPTRLQDAIRLANSLMDQKVHASSARQAENKRRWESNQGNNHVQEPQPKRQNMVRAYTTRPGEKKVYARNLPLCNKCKLHHTGPCTIKCNNCMRVGHMIRYCKTPNPTTTQRASVANQKAVVLAMSVESKDIIEVSARSLRTKTVKIKLGMEKLRKKHIHWEEEDLTKTLMLLRVRFSSIIVMLLSYLILVPIEALCRLHLAP
nr:reverse transcriptase domain-containing protein [Tanacetum cinerariifolium]